MTDSDQMAGMGALNKNMTISRGKSKKDFSQISISDLRSGMFDQVFIYSKCLGFTAAKESDSTLPSSSSVNSSPSN